MKKSKILLAVEPQILRQALRRALAKEPDVEVVGELTDVIDILAGASKGRPDVVIHSSREGSDVQSFLGSHLFAENPDLLMVDICEDDETAYAYRQIANMDGLLTAIRNHRRSQHRAGEST